MYLLLNYADTIIIIGASLGFVMAFGIGANDVSNAMGTSVGAGIITAKKAIIIASIFEFAGAYLAGGQVTHTIKNGIINLYMYANDIDTLLLGMIAALSGTSVWLILASIKGWPVSTTHSLIGALVGFACVTKGPSVVEWNTIIKIFFSWFITPFIAGCISFLIFISTQKLIFHTRTPIKRAKKICPFYMGLTTFILSLVTIRKGLSHINLNISLQGSLLISVSIAIFSIFSCYLLFKTLKFDENIKGVRAQFGQVEKIFGILMLLTACSMAFAHGSNDVSNSVGPLSVITSIVESGGIIASGTDSITWWILPLGGFGMIIGMLVLGYKVMSTIGHNITQLTPSRGFSAEFATASTVIIASGTGLPISTSQTLVGAILGVGFARGIAALNLKAIKTIFSSWVITLPAGASLAIISFYVLKIIF